VVVTLLALIGSAGAFIAAYQLITIPDPNTLLRAQTTVVSYADRTQIARLFEQDRTDVELAAVPEHTQRAVIAAENRSFYTDPGISLTGAARALWVNLTTDATVGGSTITQQYVKNMYLTSEKSYERKIKEVFISLKIDRQLTKDELLESYLNTIYFGRGAWGIESAAQAYFGTPVGELSVTQSAVLASVLRNPTLYSPESGLPALQERWAYVLDGMQAEGWLSASDRQAQVFPEIGVDDDTVRFAGQTGYLVAAAQTELTGLGFTEDQIQRGGLRVTTTFEPQAQAAAEAAIAAELPAVEEWPDNFHAALAAVRPGTGEVVAIYGGRGYQEGAFFNDAIQGAAQPGSTFKPFALTAALENDGNLRDRYDGASGREFEEYDSGRPVPNFGGADYGDIDLVTATANSVNTVYVDLTIEVGPEKVVDAATRAGIPAETQDLGAQPSVVLGVANVHPVDLANAYATFAANGAQTPWHVVSEVTDPTGEVLFTAAPEATPAFAADVMADVSFALQAVVEEGSGATAQEIGRPSAGKTGTTNDNRSSWYAGYVPQLAAAVALWEEGADASLAGFGGRDTVTGGSFPASVWTAFMQGALAGTEVVDFQEPAYVNGGNQPVSTGDPEPPPTSEAPSASPTPSEPPSAPPTSEPPTPTDEPTFGPTPPPTTPPTAPPSPPPTTTPPTRPPRLGASP